MMNPVCNKVSNRVVVLEDVKNSERDEVANTHSVTPKIVFIGEGINSK